jgi:hypothetical protein
LGLPFGLEACRDFAAGFLPMVSVCGFGGLSSIRFSVSLNLVSSSLGVSGMAGDEVDDDQIFKMVQNTIATIRSDPLDKHAQEIGRLCTTWSRLEVSLMSLLDALWAIPDRTLVNILMGALDMRGKVQVIIPLAFHRRPNDAWFDAVQTEMNTIDNVLRPERNRMVHDFWTVADGDTSANRFQFGARVVKDQRTKKLQLANIKDVSANDITLLTVAIARATGAVDLLRERYAGPPTLPRIPRPPDQPVTIDPDDIPTAG